MLLLLLVAVLPRGATDTQPLLGDPGRRLFVSRAAARFARRARVGADEPALAILAIYRMWAYTSKGHQSLTEGESRDPHHCKIRSKDQRTSLGRARPDMRRPPHSR